jgi:FkbM family methyltransferase
MFITFGAPRSGLTALNKCLDLLGVRPSSHQYCARAKAINRKLIESFGISPLTPGALQYGWLQSDIANRAQDQVMQLIDGYNNQADHFFVSDPVFCYTLPLWVESLKTFGISPVCIHLIRHPWEVALSLTDTLSCTLDTALIIWLSYARSSFRNNTKQEILLYDQLLTNPISELCVLVEKYIQGVSIENHLSILDFIQPGMKHFYTSLFDKKEMYGVYDNIYNRIKVEKITIDLALGLAGNDLLEKYDKSSTNDLPASPDLIDTFLQTAGVYASSSLSQSSDALNQEKSLKIRLGFSEDKLSSFLLTPNEWQKVVYKLRPSEDEQQKLLFIEPLNAIGIVYFSNIRIVDNDTGEIVLLVSADQNIDKLGLKSGIIRQIEKNNVSFFTTTDSPLIVLDLDLNCNCKNFQIECWVKVNKGFSSLNSNEHLVVDCSPEAIKKVIANKLFWSNGSNIGNFEFFLDFYKSLSLINEFLPQMSDNERSNMYADFISSQEKIIHARAMANLGKNNIINFKDASFSYFDSFGAWTCMLEILVQQEYFFKAETEHPKIIDCGANVGLAVYYFKHLYPNSSIIAFEPIPLFYKILQANIETNKWKNVDTFPFAIDGADGSSDFYVSKKMSLAGTLTQRRLVAGDELEKITVQKRCLSHYLRSPVDYLKLDIEGSEDAVLNESRHLLGNVQHIFCEYHHGLGMESNRLKVILDVLDETGFDYHVSKSVNFTKQTSFRPMKYVGAPYSAVIFAKNKDWKNGQEKAAENLKNESPKKNLHQFQSE